MPSASAAYGGLACRAHPRQCGGSQRGGGDAVQRVAHGARLEAEVELLEPVGRGAGRGRSARGSARAGRRPCAGARSPRRRSRACSRPCRGRWRACRAARAPERVPGSSSGPERRCRRAASTSAGAITASRVSSRHGAGLQRVELGGAARAPAPARARASRSARGRSPGSGLGRRDADRAVLAQPARGAPRELGRGRAAGGRPALGHAAPRRGRRRRGRARAARPARSPRARAASVPLSGAAHSATPP